MRWLGCVTAIDVLLLAGCTDRMVELATEREPAVVVDLVKGPVRCPAATVTHGDDDPASGAGAVPADFEGRTVLRCDLDYSTMQLRDGVEHVSVRQWQAPMTPQLHAALDLPDRELRPARACAAGSGGITTVYLVDPARRSVRVLLPREDPCQRIRAETVAVLPANGSPAEASFEVSRPAR